LLSPGRVDEAKRAGITARTERSQVSGGLVIFKKGEGAELKSLAKKANSIYKLLDRGSTGNDMV